MAVHGYVLVDAEVGKAKAISEALAQLERPDAQVIAVDTVTGPYDVILQLEADDLDKMGRFITEGVQRVEGVQRTTTCLAVRYWLRRPPPASLSGPGDAKSARGTGSPGVGGSPAPAPSDRKRRRCWP